MAFKLSPSSKLKEITKSGRRGWEKHPAVWGNKVKAQTMKRLKVQMAKKWGLNPIYL